MKHGFFASVIIAVLAFSGCNNYFHEIIPPTDNKILSFTVPGQTRRAVIKGNSVSVTADKDTDIRSLIPRITVSRKASLLPLTLEYIQAAFPSANVLGRAAEMYTRDDFADHIFDLIREDKNFNVPKLTIPIDFSVPVDFLVISGKGNIRRYTVYVTKGITTVIITGLGAADKVYDGTTTATITGTAVIEGLIPGDTVTVNYGTADFENANVGNDKTVTFSGFSLAGADAGKYSLSAQPESVTASIFEQSDSIAFTDPEPHIVKTYGDAAFTNAITDGHGGSGTITYSSGDETVATVDNDGLVTMHKVGTTVITAHKAADAGYAEATRSYILTVEPKPVSISGLGAADKVYDRTTTVTISGTAVINGLISGDTVTVNYGTAAFASAVAGNNKTVTFSGFSLVGADAGNYSLSAQPASVTANITVPPIEVVWINAGTFTMGSPTDEPGRYSSNETQHQVTLTQGFYMGKYQVTQLQYEAVMGTNPSNFKTPVSPETSTDNRPVETVSWYDALVFCNKLSTLEGLSPAYRINGSTDPAVWGTVPTSSNATWDAVAVVAGSTGYRLPTEAQWEYACRAGRTTAFNWGTDYINSTQANYRASTIDANNTVAGIYLGRTTTVGSYVPNAWGLYDMHGNVYEYCWDWYDMNYGGTAGAAVTDPVGASSGSLRVFRGGYWYSNGQHLRSAYRSYNYPSLRSYDLGIRLLLPL